MPGAESVQLMYTLHITYQPCRGATLINFIQSGIFTFFPTCEAENSSMLGLSKLTFVLLLTMCCL